MLQPISLEQLKELSEKVKGRVIEIPGFGNTDVIPVRVKEISLLDLVQCDILPNPLLITVNNVIQRQASGEVLSEEEAAQARVSMEQFTNIVFKQALVEPTYEDFKNAGIELTTIQKRMISEYAIGDTTTYDRFRRFRDDFESNMASKDVSQATK